MMRHLGIKLALGGLLAVSGGIGVIGWHGTASAENAAKLANPQTAHIPAPRTFHTNQLPIPKTAPTVPSGSLPASVTITSGQARAIAIRWIEAHRTTQQVVPPAITKIALVSSAAAEQKMGTQPGLPPDLWAVTFTSSDFSLFGPRSGGIVYVNTETGTVPMAYGNP